MSAHTPNELADAFPDDAEALHQLKLTNAHFAKLAEQHHAVNREIHRIETEIDAATQLADEIAGYLQAEGWGTPLRMMSGNGVHLYVPLDLPNDATSRVQVRTLLGKLAGKFDTPAVQVDTCVHNASRITKVPGTIARKGEPSEARPWRMARVL
jgi:uncharacterized protein YdcH (DUF465 family)